MYFYLHKRAAISTLESEYLPTSQSISPLLR